MEKPLGHDLAAFLEIHFVLTRHSRAEQVFRIDHFPGKETVQDIRALRFTNPILEPIWNRRHIDHIVIAVTEAPGVEHRRLRRTDRRTARHGAGPPGTITLLAAMQPTGGIRGRSLWASEHRGIDHRRWLAWYTPEPGEYHAA